MKKLIVIILNLCIPILFYFIVGLLYFSIYGFGGEFDYRRVLLFNIIYFIIGVFHLIFFYKKWSSSFFEKSILSTVIIFEYFYLAFIIGR